MYLFERKCFREKHRAVETIYLLVHSFSGHNDWGRSKPYCSRSMEIHLDLPYGCLRPKYSGHHPLLFQAQ